MAALAKKFHTKVLRCAMEGMNTRDTGKLIDRSWSAVARYLRSPEAIERLERMGEERDRAVGRNLAAGSEDAAAWLRAVVDGKTVEGKAVAATVAEKTVAAKALLDRSNHAAGVNVKVDATITAKPLTDAETLLELQEVLGPRLLTDSKAAAG